MWDRFKYCYSEQVKKLRKKLGLTQAELAKRSKVSLKTITNIETGRLGGGITLSTMAAVSFGLGSNIKDVFLNCGVEVAEEVFVGVDIGNGESRAVVAHWNTDLDRWEEE